MGILTSILILFLYLRCNVCDWYKEKVEQWPDRETVKQFEHLTCSGEPEERNIVYIDNCHVGNCPSYREYRLDNEGRQFVLDWHNDWRNRIAIGKEARGGCARASNMMVLNYDMDLEFLAMCFARRCTHDLEHCRRTKNFFRSGQNVYEHPSDDELRRNSTDYLLRKALETWFEEIDSSSRKLLKMYTPSNEWKHFTQMIWHSTTHIGCGRVHYKKGPINVDLVACNYGPKGNDEYQEVYKFGTPTSECPNPHTQNSEYEGLCGTHIVLDHKHRYKVSIASHVLPHLFLLILLFVCIRL